MISSVMLELVYCKFAYCSFNLAQRLERGLQKKLCKKCQVEDLQRVKFQGNRLTVVSIDCLVTVSKLLVNCFMWTKSS